jgi:hypothetical protein
MRIHLQTRSFAALAAAWGLCAAPAVALAQESALERSYFAAKLQLGIGGEVEVDTVAGSVEDDLELGWGAALQYMARLHKHFALGGLLGFESWQSEGRDDANLDRNLLFDLAVVPQGVLPVGRDVELYLALGLGLSLDTIGDDEINIGGTLVSAEIDTALGFALLPVLGVRFAVSRDVGLLAEIGYALHTYEHEADATVVIGGASTDIDLTLGELALNLGVTF